MLCSLAAHQILLVLYDYKVILSEPNHQNTLPKLKAETQKAIREHGRDEVHGRLLVFERPNLEFIHMDSPFRVEVKYANNWFCPIGQCIGWVSVKALC